jgi:hypothetical protein
MVASTLVLRAQGWDAATQAQGWARQDKDDSFTFYDPAAKMLHTWMRDGGEFREIPLATLDGPPAKWIIDPRGYAWVGTGTALVQVEPTGKIDRSIRRPAEVGSVCWDTKGFVLSFKAVNPYLEKRRYQDGDLIWTYGSKPGSKAAPTAPNSYYPLLMDDLDHILLGNGRDLNLVSIDGDTGKANGKRDFTFHGAPGPLLGSGSGVDRGPLCLWSGKNVAFASLEAADLPETLRGSLQGQVLARLDLATSTLAFLPTGLPADYQLVGVLDSNAVFVNPKGGLTLLSVK